MNTEDIQKWFEELKAEKPDWAPMISEIKNGISDRGFDPAKLNESIDNALKQAKLDYESEFNPETKNETEGDKD